MMESYATTLSQSSAQAKQTWELQNDITTVLDLGTHKNGSVQICNEEQPWINDPSYFKKAKISELALLRMAMHVKSSRDMKVIGLLRGTTDGDAFVVVDAFALPVEADKTSVNPLSELLEYYKTQTQDGDLENVVGWYRTHTGPVFFCGPDISAQEQIQQLKEPSLALIIDPATTYSFGKVDIGAFRTYPEGYTPPDKPVRKYRTNLPPVIVEQQRHLDKGCQLDITYFKSLLDTNLLEDLWNSYWACTNSSTLGLKSVDRKVSALGHPDTSTCFHAEKKAALTVYFIVAKYHAYKKYEASTGYFGRAKELFTELMEEAGSSGNQIKSYMSSFFFAELSEEQAKKLSSSDRVKQVRPERELVFEGAVRSY